MLYLIQQVDWLTNFRVTQLIYYFLPENLKLKFNLLSLSENIHNFQFSTQEIRSYI